MTWFRKVTDMHGNVPIEKGINMGMRIPDFQSSEDHFVEESLPNHSIKINKDTKYTDNTL